MTFLSFDGLNAPTAPKRAWTLPPNLVALLRERFTGEVLGGVRIGSSPRPDSDNFTLLPLLACLDGEAASFVGRFVDVMLAMA